MKVAVLGAGAIGGLLGARIVKSGHQVSVLARGRTLGAIRENGLGLVEENTTEFFSVQASDNPQELGPQDLIIIAVKQPALNTILRLIRPMMNDQTQVLIAMNGVPWWFLDGLDISISDPVIRCIDPNADARDLLPTERILGCVVHIAASVTGPGISQRNMGNRLVIGAPLKHSNQALTERCSTLLQDSGFDTFKTDHIHKEIWFKLWGNLTMNPISVLTGATSDKILDDALINRFVVRAMNEAAEIGDALQLPIDQTPEERNAVTRELGAMRTSMLQDAEIGRSLEHEAIVGAVYEIAKKLRIDVPAIEALYGLVRLYDQVHSANYDSRL